MVKVNKLRFYINFAILFAASALYLTRSVINIALPQMMTKANKSEDKMNLYRSLELTSFDTPTFLGALHLLYQCEHLNNGTNVNKLNASSQVHASTSDFSRVSVENQVNRINGCTGCSGNVANASTVFANLTSSDARNKLRTHDEWTRVRSAPNDRSNGDSEDNNQQDGEETGDYFSRLAKEKYNWPESTAGMVQSAFFVGYILLQIPAASLADRYGAKKFILVCVGGSALLTLITPFIAFMPIVLMISRFVFGLVQSCMFPSCFVILINWLPAKDKTFGFACLSIASYVGSVIIYSASGEIVDSLGWPYLFWIAGFICTVGTIIIAFFLTSKPEDHPFITEEELELIKGNESHEMSQSSSTVNTVSTQVTFVNGTDEKAATARITRSKAVTSEMDNGKNTRMSTVSLGTDENTVYDDVEDTKTTRPPIPWIGMLTNKPVLVTLNFRFVQASMFQLYYNKLPVFLIQMLNQSAKQNGWMNAAVQFLAGTSALGVGSISERLIERGFMPRTRLRKFFGFICGIGQALCLAGVALSFTHGMDGAVIFFILLSAFFIGFVAGAETPLPAEMSKNFGPTVYALFNIAAMIPGIIVPSLVDMTLTALKDDQSTAWTVVFYSAGSLMALATIPFLIFASAERQPFDMTDEEIFEDRLRSPSAVSWRYSVS